MFWVTGASFSYKTGISVLILYARNSLNVIHYFKAGKQSLEGPIKGPEGSRRLRLPDIETVGT